METVTLRDARIHALWPTAAVLIALVALFIGERVMGGDSAVRTSMAVIGAVAIVAAAAARGREMAGASVDKKPVANLLFFTTVGVALGMALYAAIPLVFTADDAKTSRAVLWALWPIVVVCSVAPMVAMEIAVYSVAYIDRYEPRRVRKAFERGLAFGLAASAIVVGNYLADRHDVKWDLSYGQKARMSEQTARAIRDLTEPVKITLFFPRANEVAEAMEPYFDSVRAGSPQVTVSVVDHALAGDLAKDAGVTENGYVVVSRNKSNEKIRIGDKMTSARSSMRKFDQNFLGALLKVTREKKTAYFTTGHGERSTTPDAKDTRTGLKSLKSLLESNQFSVKPLGIAEGLSVKIPNDAAVVFVMGPEKAFSPPEMETLKNSLDQGARLFIALEAEREGQGLEPLLELLGLKFEKTILANERTFVPFTKTEADRTSIWSNRYSSHESVTTMTRNAKLATIFEKTGWLSKLDKVPERTKLDIVLTAVDDTFADENSDLKKNDNEKAIAYGMAAAITKTATTGKRQDEARVFVTADVDVYGDELMKNEGNIRLLADVVYWLRAVEEPVVPALSEADVQIVHKKEGDAAMFYGTTLGVPAIVLALGMMSTRRKRR